MKIKEESMGTTASRNLFRGNSPNIFEYIHVIRAAKNIDVIMISVLE